MIITVIIFAITCTLVFGYAMKGLRLTKRTTQLNMKFANFVVSFNETAGQTTDSNQQLVDMYNERVTLDEDLIDYHDCMTKLAVIMAIFAAVLVFAAIVL